VKKLLLLSVIIFAVAIPARHATAKNPTLGLKKTLKQTAIFNVIYLGLLLYVWHRL
jgi:hypothetical protein